MDASIAGATCPFLQLLMPVWVISSGPLPPAEAHRSIPVTVPGSQVQGFLLDEHEEVSPAGDYLLFL